jgi:thioredoxin-related protein
MRFRSIVAVLLLVSAPSVDALLHPDYEKFSLAQALERAKADPSKHVMIYFGLETFCPPCIYTRNLMSGSSLRALYKPNYAVVEIDLRNPSPAQRKVIAKFGARWAPTLVFLDANGKTVARLSGGFNNEKEAVLTHEFVSQKLYAKSDLTEYVKANLNQRGSQRVVPETKIAHPAAPPDDRPRLRDVLAQRHERILGDDLKQLLHSKRMEKENQDWFLTMMLESGGKVAAHGKRKDGRASMKGDGVWYVTKKGKFCIDVKAQGLEESWCRHVFRVGENYYYATKDLRGKSLAYRFTLEKI